MGPLALAAQLRVAVVLLLAGVAVGQYSNQLSAAPRFAVNTPFRSTESKSALLAFSVEP